MAKFNFYDERPTAKQINFAQDIAEVCGVQLPEERTKAAYSEFISANIDAYRLETYDWDNEDAGDRD